MNYFNQIKGGKCKKPGYNFYLEVEKNLTKKGATKLKERKTRISQQSLTVGNSGEIYKKVKRPEAGK